MSELHRSPQSADQSALADAERDILHRIIKLRWMGMEAQARRLQLTLSQLTLSQVTLSQ
jgi:hypothetical protein